MPTAASAGTVFIIASFCFMYCYQFFGCIKKPVPFWAGTGFYVRIVISPFKHRRQQLFHRCPDGHASVQEGFRKSKRGERIYGFIFRLTGTSCQEK
jgi:hypothetical protein